jgi:general secretion pathway protein K
MRRQRGVALIIALILVSLATMLAWKISFDGYLERRRSVGMLAAEQSFEFALGAEALAADVLVQDLQTNKQTTLAGIWAQSSVPFPISSPSDPDGEPIGTLQGGIEDLQGRFNLNNLGRLLPSGLPDPQPFEQFERLLASLNLETKWAGLARDWIDADNLPGNPDGAEDAIYTAQIPPYLTGNWPMTSTSELMALPGFDLGRYLKLAPYVTALPTAVAQINLCTASAPVLESLAPSLSGDFIRNEDALVIGRKTGCYPDINTFKNMTTPKDLAAINGQYADTSSYFRLTTHVTLGTSEYTLYSLLLRGRGGKVTPLLRSLGTQ